MLDWSTFAGRVAARLTDRNPYLYRPRLEDRVRGPLQSASSASVLNTDAHSSLARTRHVNVANTIVDADTAAAVNSVLSTREVKQLSIDTKGLRAGGRRSSSPSSSGATNKPLVTTPTPDVASKARDTTRRSSGSRSGGRASTSAHSTESPFVELDDGKTILSAAKDKGGVKGKAKTKPNTLTVSTNTTETKTSSPHPSPSPPPSTSRQGDRTKASGGKKRVSLSGAGGDDSDGGDDGSGDDDGGGDGNVGGVKVDRDRYKRALNAMTAPDKMTTSLLLKSKHYNYNHAVDAFNVGMRLQHRQWPELISYSPNAFIRIGRTSTTLYCGLPFKVLRSLQSQVQGLGAFCARLLHLKMFNQTINTQVTSLCLALMSKFDPALYQVSQQSVHTYV